ncbi:uncharacterized protein LOC131649172 [Vicia villosa]|uniref:uncharacterized protein LOC131649172 n=1 Tax=Vicia villosa TaxID=3911 RepID=UPI00273B18B0|nr:uncharacterized protein LOC131649172 [Vicia villosa]
MAVAAGSYRGFQYGVNNSVDILHYADDTIILGDDKLQNLWSLKAVLRCFELMSGLEVMQATASFLTCSVGSLPFKFLGVMVGDSPRKIKMWKDVVRSVKNRLDVWRGRVPKAVVKVLVTIQRNFLWNGLVEKKAICWVKWEDVCRVKEEGGLGIRDIEGMNVSLLMVKNGTKTAFWFSKWIGNQSLAEAFRELYGLAANQFMTMAEAGRWQDDVTLEKEGEDEFEWEVNAAPSKVQVLAWRMVLDRMPTRSQLKRRGILHDEADCRCVFCLDHMEDSTHLFVECPVLEKIWEKV